MASPSPVLPPLDGSISVLPGFVDFHATHNADLPWALLSAGPELPVQSVSFAQYARATHRIAHKLRPERAGQDKEVVAILINCDTILYLALIVGLVRAGLVVRKFSALPLPCACMPIGFPCVVLALPHVSEELRPRHHQHAETDIKPSNYFSAGALPASF